MDSINIKLLAVLGVNALIIMALVAHQAYHPDSSPPTLSDLLKVPKNEEHTFSQDKFSLRSQYDEEPSYVFDNPAIALHLLNNLDVFEVVKAGEVPGAKYTAYTEGYTYDYDYCKKHRAYFVENPEIVFGELNFITNYWMDHKLRTTVIPEIGYDLMPEVSHSYKNRTRVYKFDFRLDGTMFFMFNIFSKWRQVGVQFSCLSQESNHIPGHDSMARKDKLGAALVAYAQKYESKPHCFNFDKYFPKTWVMQDKKQCLDFFQEFLSPRYEELKKERKVVYFRKIGANVHEGKGVFPLNSEKEENYLRKTYKDGALCGKVKKNFLMQTNVHNLLLLDGRKFGVRVFLLVASVNPVIAYFHDGYYRLSMHKYDPNSTTRGTFVTNIGVNLINPADGKTEEQIQEETTWYNKQVQDFLLETNVIQDPHWVDNYLRPEYKKVMVHLLRMAQSKFVPVSSVFEIHGIDFIMDQNLNLWFIEANPYPLINGFTKESTVLLNKMLIDMFEIQAGLLKSRMKRVIQYINLLSSTMKSDSDVISNLAQKRQQFRELSKNYFEPEYVPKPGNGFQKIVDENLQGADRYAGLIEPQCL